MKINISLCKNSIVSKQDAINRGYFGPVYHGTSEFKQNEISKDGFKIFVGGAGVGNVTNGFSEVAFPIHTLGYGVYFTESAASAKKYAGNNKQLKEYYLDVPKLETINYASRNTMMNWWISNGFDPLLNSKDRIAATLKMTEVLKSKFDAVYHKGKSVGRSFDGNQICVFDPSRIYEVDPNLSKGFEIGARVKRKTDGMKGVILEIFKLDTTKVLSMLHARLNEITEEEKERFLPVIANRIKTVGEIDKLPAELHFMLKIRWSKGGTEYNIAPNEVYCT